MIYFSCDNILIGIFELKFYFKDITSTTVLRLKKTNTNKNKL